MLPRQFICIDPRYQPSSRDDLSNTCICAWYTVEKSNVIQKLAQVNEVAITWDGWTSVAQDTGHFHTITVHYIYKGKMKQNMLSTEVVYESQTGAIVAKEIASTVEQFRFTFNIVNHFHHNHFPQARKTHTDRFNEDRGVY